MWWNYHCPSFQKQDWLKRHSIYPCRFVGSNLSQTYQQQTAVTLVLVNVPNLVWSKPTPRNSLGSLPSDSSSEAEWTKPGSTTSGGVHSPAGSTGDMGLIGQLQHTPCFSCSTISGSLRTVECIHGTGGIISQKACKRYVQTSFASVCLWMSSSILHCLEIVRPLKNLDAPCCQEKWAAVVPNTSTHNHQELLPDTDSVQSVTQHR